MFERYNEEARRIIFSSRYEASRYGSSYIETEHLLLGFFHENNVLAGRLFPDPDASESIRKEIEAQITIREKTSTSVDLPLSHESKRVLAYAAEEAGRHSDPHIKAGHLLIGLLREENFLSTKVLRQRGFPVDSLREQLDRP